MSYWNTTGNHTYAAINAQENYDTLSSDMNDVMKSINDLIAKPEVMKLIPRR